MRPGLIVGFLLLVTGCAVDGLDASTPEAEAEPHRLEPCALDATFRFVPADGAYEVDAAPDTILAACSDASGMLGQPYDVVLAPFPDFGPQAEAVVSFTLPAGGCYELVLCANDAKAPELHRLNN
jgi:hypothetical protein